MNRREKLCEWLFESSKGPYGKYIKKNKEWELTREDLMSYDKESLGYALGSFLTTNDFQLLPKLERHDVYHVLTDFTISVKDEIAMQFFFFGNGKRSLYLFFVMIVGAFLFPEHYRYFKKCYRQGTEAISFGHWHMLDFLHLPLSRLKKIIYGNKPIPGMTATANNNILTAI